MKAFIKKLLLFLLVPLLIVVGFEIYVYTVPSAMKQSATYFLDNRGSIELLVLGSSHPQNAINPEYFKSLKVSNLASGGQDLEVDSMLLFGFINDMPKLKYVVLELSYFSLEYAHPENHPKKTLYYKYFGLDLFNKWLDYRRFTIFWSSPALYFKTLDFSKSFGKFNKYGYQTEMSDFEKVHDRFGNANYDTTIIDKDLNNSFITGHMVEHLDVYERNRVIFESMVKLCAEKGITPIVLLPPMYKTYVQEMKPAKKQRRDDFLEAMEQKYSTLKVWDYEVSHGYQATDFTNPDHLNPVGSKQFTERLDSLIQTYK